MRKTWKPTTAGVLNIISGAFFLIGGIAVFGQLKHPAALSWASYVMYSMELDDTTSLSGAATIIVILATALVVLGAVSILGGICSIKRSSWGLALAGSISTFLSSMFLGIPAIALTVLAKKEFAQYRRNE